MIPTVLSEKISEETINIRYSDIDVDKSLKPFCLLNFFQDIASDNAERLGFGYSFIYPKNLIWVLLKYRIEFNDYPSDIQKLTLRTEPRGFNKLFAYRDFELFSGEHLIARASSMWTLVDIVNKSLTNIGNVIIDNSYMSKYMPSEDDLKFEKIPNLEKADFEKEFEVRYNDIDVNMHANNGNYIIWALEPLDHKFRLNHKLKNIDMIFKKESKLGDKIMSRVQMINNNVSVHSLINAETKEDLCLLKCEWT